MKCFSLLLFIAIFGGTWRLGRPTCVLESDFGFIINCAFKKSGLFRVRNLGGVKAHIGLGFTVGDELGFKESISNVEINRRRSAQTNKAQIQLIQAQQQMQQKQNPKSVRSSTSIENRDSTKKDAMLDIVPPFRPIPPAPERPVPLNSSKQKVVTPSMMGVAVPSYNVMPSSNSRLSQSGLPPADISNSMIMTAIIPNKASDKLSSTDFALRTLPTPNNELPSPHSHTSSSLQAILAANNVTEEALEAALLQRQQLILAKSKLASSSTTFRPHPSDTNFSNSVGKVMNAPKEYYPVGYDKNFDDNFASRVELPETSFYCGDQKHFPGLYADEDLGCMVFHVCALTDDGLIMKSFLCPESTLFDQTILKCNWWFYVDCKVSKKLYDSNIPISKSYQLMKALTFFSGYKKESSSSSSTPRANEKD